MRLEDLLTDGAVLAEIGRRVERHRLQRNWTQAQLAYEAQVGRATVQRVERGQSVQTLSLVKLLRQLDLLTALDGALPESIELPIVELERAQRHDRKRARVSSKRTRQDPERAWRWGEESGADG